MAYSQCLLICLFGLLGSISAQDTSSDEDSKYKLRCFTDRSANTYKFLSDVVEDGEYVMTRAKASLFYIRDGLSPDPNPDSGTEKYVSLESSENPSWYLREPHIETQLFYVTMDNIDAPKYNASLFNKESTWKMQDSNDRPGFQTFMSLTCPNHFLYCNRNSTVSIMPFQHGQGITAADYYDRSSWEMTEADSTEAAIICDETSVNITVFSWTLTDIVDTYLHVGGGDQDPRCRFESDEHGHQHIIFGLNECGAFTSMDDVHIAYSYEVTTGSFTEGQTGVTRNKFLGIRLGCVFDRTGSVQTSYTGKILHTTFETTFYGTLMFSMGLYDDEPMTNAVTKYQPVTLGKPVYVKISLHSGASWPIFVTDCVAKPSEGSTDHYSLIKDGCFNEEDGTLDEVPVADGRHNYAFTFLVFKFRGVAVSTVFIECTTVVCSEEDPSIGCNKPQHCSGGKRSIQGHPLARAAKAPQTPQSFKLAHGPFIVVNSNSD